MHITRCRKYVRGAYGSFFQSEALPRALPFHQNSPQHPPYGLYPELVSGTAFTAPRVKNRYSWVYRIYPSIRANPASFQEIKHDTFAPTSLPKTPPIPLRTRPVELPVFAADFVDGLITMAVNGSPRAHDGATANVYAINKSMDRVFLNIDADMMILPEQGGLTVRTEFGDLDVEPTELVLIPRGMSMQVLINQPTARGYALENFGDQFVIPDLGPIGISGGLAHPRHFLAPDAKFEDNDKPMEMIVKLDGNLWKGERPRTPFDVVAWYGNYVPVKYDMKLFMAINSVTYDHPDPSIGCVMSSYTSSPGVANIDFVIFPPRYMVAENTFRPPWYHRNVMSEFMGLIKGAYDAKPTFQCGSTSIHNQFVPHGPDAAALKAGTELDTSKQERYENTLAFMWESNKVWHPTETFLALNEKEYPATWSTIPKRFDANNVPPEKERLPFSPSRS